MIKELRQLKTRYRLKQESLTTILLRPIFYTNRLRRERLNVVAEEWDYLIVLDACRYDTFKELNFLDGELRKAYSAGTHTVEWVKENFKGDFPDIVYISANPQVSHPQLKKWVGNSNPFYHLENLWDEGWDDDILTVHPETVNKATLRLVDKYPDKRFIIHYLQPHHPFIGDNNLNLSEREYSMINSPNWSYVLNNHKLEDIKKAYKENLRFVLGYLKELTKNLEGKTVVTADHGEAFGELGIYSHVPSMYIKSLFEVPWFEVCKVKGNFKSENIP